MNLLHFRYFYEVAKTGSFTESAKNLRVSQPAISKMVRGFEQDLGHGLLERTRKGVKLTKQGEMLFQVASRVFSEVDRVKELLSVSDRELRGEWSLGVSDNIAVYLIPSLLGKFKEKHPQLRISLFCGTSSQIKNELHYDRCRLGVFYTKPKASEPFQVRQIHETEFWVVIQNKSRWFRKTRLSLSDLIQAKVPRIESRHRDYSAGFPAHFHSKRLGLTSSPWLEVNQHEVKKRFVQEGFGYALLTRPTVEKEVQKGSLLRVATREPLLAPIYAAWRRGRELGDVSQAFLSEFQRSLGQLG